MEEIVMAAPGAAAGLGGTCRRARYMVDMSEGAFVMVW